MERRNFLKSLALVPFAPRLLRGFDWAAYAPEEAVAAGMGGYSALVPAGSILPFAAEGCPPGFLPCDGRLVPTMGYQKLHKAIGKAYGGGRGFFRTPDLLSRPAAVVRLQEQNPAAWASPAWRYVIKT